MGQGSFTLSSDGTSLLYNEQGQLQIGHYSDIVHRRYLYHFPDQNVPQKAQVCFEDGRTFHDLDLSTGEHTATHHCPPDLYAGWFQVKTPSLWQTRWKITGPRKNITIRTEFTRTPE